MKLAKGPADYVKAQNEFTVATTLAPWVFEYHYNLAIARKSAADFNGAISSAKLAKILAQNEKDRRDANGLRAEIEAAQDIAGSAKAEADKAAASQAEVRRFRGSWYRDERNAVGDVMHIRVILENAPDGSWRFSEAYNGNAANPTQGIHDVRLLDGVLQFMHDDLILYPDGPLKCGVYEVRLSLSSDGNKLTWDRRTTPLPSDRSNRCPLPKYFASAVWEFRREP